MTWTSLSADRLSCWFAPLRLRLARLGRRQSRFHHASEISQILLNLMQDLQQHRALSGAVLDGRTEFNSELEATELNLQRFLHALVDYYGNRHPIFHSAQWRIVLGRWESLRNNWRDLDFHTNITVHSEVVLGVVGILQSLANSHCDDLTQARARIIGRWPILIEQLGMLRALGLHALCHQNLLEDARLTGAIAEYLRDARQSLEEVEGDTRSMVVVRSQRALRRVAWLMDGNAAKYHPYTYYEEVTAVIDDWYGLLRSRIRADVDTQATGQQLATN